MDNADIEHDMRVTIPNDPWNEVLPTRLWIGGSLMGGDLSRFGAVVSLSRSGDAFAPVPKDTAHMTAFFGDTAAIPTATLAHAVRNVAHFMALGHEVLVRCQAGLNRSGLVVASVLVDHEGWDPAEAIAHLRAVRDPMALFNPTFEAHLLGTVNACPECTTDGHRCTTCNRVIVHGTPTCRIHAPRGTLPA